MFLVRTAFFFISLACMAWAAWTVPLGDHTAVEHAEHMLEKKFMRAAVESSRELAVDALQQAQTKLAEVGNKPAAEPDPGP